MKSYGQLHANKLENLDDKLKKKTYKDTAAETNSRNSKGIHTYTHKNY